MIGTAFSAYRDPKIWIVLALGFSSGLPLLLTGSTLSFWLTKEGVSTATIGVFALLGTPYALKFLWSPVMDSLGFPVLSRMLGLRRGWLLATQAGLMCSLAAMACVPPGEGLMFTATLALLVAFLSASQDIVVDAFRVESLASGQQGNGAAAVTLGYRLGMIAASFGALKIAASGGWPLAYVAAGASMSVGIAATLLAREPLLQRGEKKRYASLAGWIRDSVAAPLADFAQRRGWWLIALFIVLYKLGDAFSGGNVISNFYLKIGYGENTIADIVKFYGVIATIAGNFLGGWLIWKLGAMRVLWIGGIAQAATNLFFVAIARHGPDTALLAAAVTFDNVAGGIGTAAFVAYLSSLCNLHFTATQYALMSSFASFGRTWLAAPSGIVAEALGWEWFFLFSVVLALPGLFCLVILKRVTATSPPAAATSG